MPGIGTIDSGRFVERLRNTLHTSQEKDHIERDTDPDVGKDGAIEGKIWVDQPVARSIDQAQLAKRIVDYAEVTIKHPTEDTAADHRREHPSEEKQRPQNPVARERLVEEQGERKAERELKEQRASREDQGDSERVPEVWALDHRPVVIKSDKRGI